MQTIDVIDSHTGGEPTRIVVAGGPELGSETLAERLQKLRTGFDEFRSAVVNEPRGSDVMVGGLLVEPHAPDCCAGILFFNNVGYLGMCGHGTIGLIKTLAHMGRIAAGVHRVDTPVGVVTAELRTDGRVTVGNVPSYRYLADVTVEVPKYGRVVGDVAYGGNWFFLVREGPDEKLHASRQADLTRVALQIRDALKDQGVTGEHEAYIDHVELFGPAKDPRNDSQNFVLCPGGAYDRSPCGTGTSAKLACLAADGKLAPGEVWQQESVIGSVFACTYENDERPGWIQPHITGTAFICSEARLLLDPQDPFRNGIRA